MINEETSKLTHKVDGKFSLTVGSNPDIYQPSVVVTSLEEKLTMEKEALASLRKQFTLGLFRDIVHEHEAKFGMKPTKVILNYREFANITEASNNEENSHYQSSYNDTNEIDGITICKGCNTKPGEFRIETLK